jgi:hypothetical protein
MNGLGEYVLATTRYSSDSSWTLEIQGRTEAVSEHATVFTVFAVQENDGDVVQVEFINSQFVVYVNGESEDIYFDYQPFNGVRITQADYSVNLELDSGSSVVITRPQSTTVPGLQIFARLANVYADKTRGLLGNFDGDDTNDLITSQDVLVSSEATEEEILQEFAQSWLLDEDTTILTYTNGEGPDDYIDLFFTPQFGVQFESDEDENYARSICGDDIFCLFDFSQTKDSNFALSTLDTNMLLKESKTISELVIECSPSCNNDGACISTNVCTCQPGYSGNQCQHGGDTTTTSDPVTTSTTTSASTTRCNNGRGHAYGRGQGQGNRRGCGEGP